VRKLKCEVVWNLEENINEVWNKAVNLIKSVAVDIVGKSKGSLPHNKTHSASVGG